jgi:hypothetical protein
VLCTKEIHNKKEQASSLSQRASGWDPATLSTKSHWVPAQKHTGMTMFRVFFDLSAFVQSSQNINLSLDAIL